MKPLNLLICPFSNLHCDGIVDFVILVAENFGFCLYVLSFCTLILFYVMSTWLHLTLNDLTIFVASMASKIQLFTLSEYTRSRHRCIIPSNPTKVLRYLLFWQEINTTWQMRHKSKSESENWNGKTCFFELVFSFLLFFSWFSAMEFMCTCILGRNIILVIKGPPLW